MLPNPADVTESVETGVPPGETPGSIKFTRFNELNSSARNWRRRRSLTGIFLKNDMSQLKSPGPRMEFRPTLPNVPMAGRTKEFGFSQSTQGAVFPQPPVPRAGQ